MRTTNRLRLILLTALHAACTGSATGVAELHPDQRFLFGTDYVNYAWGFSASGIYIDRQGDVWSYALEAPWRSGEQTAFSGEELLEKYDVGRTHLARVDADQLGRMFALVEEAGRGTLTEPVNRCNDAGTVAFLAYTYDPAAKRYSTVLLRQEGDWARENRSAAADELYRWLKELGAGSGISGCEP